MLRGHGKLEHGAPSNCPSLAIFCHKVIQSDESSTNPHKMEMLHLESSLSRIRGHKQLHDQATKNLMLLTTVAPAFFTQLTPMAIVVHGGVFSWSRWKKPKFSLWVGWVHSLRWLWKAVARESSQWADINHPYYVERKVSQSDNICRLVGSGKWPGLSQKAWERQ